MILFLRLMGGLFFLALSSSAWAGFQKDGISLSLGGTYTQVDSNISSTLVGDNNSVGGTLDFESDLLLEESSSQPLFELSWAFKERHQLSLNYFQLNRSGTTANMADVDIGELSFKAGALLQSQLDLSLWQFKYAYSIYQTDKMAFGGSLGLHAIDFDIKFNGVAVIQGEKDGVDVESIEHSTGISNTVPLPNIGLYYHYLLTEDFYLNLDAQYFAIKLDISDSDTLDAGMLALDAGAEYYPWQQFSLYLGVSYYDVYANLVQGIEAGDIEWDVNFKYWGPKIVAKYTF